MGLDVALWQARFVEYLTLRGRAPLTVRSYRHSVQAFLEYLAACGLESLGQLTRDHLEEYRLHLYRRRSRVGRSLTVGYQASSLAAVRSFVRFLVRQEYLRFDIGADLEMPKVPRSIRPTLSEAETRRLLDAIDLTGPLGLRDRALLEVLYSTALRNGELISLRLDDLDFERGWVRVGRGKGGKSRMVPLGEEAAAWLEAYLTRERPRLCREGHQGRVFLTANGRPLTRNALCYRVRHLAELAGCTQRVTPHLLRHCCATHMLRRGAGLRQLQAFLGHEVLTSTQHYTQVDLKDLRQALRRYHPRERQP